ncbi:hypothetical protein Pmani_016394 [Petrolisthes manimaculis]|uniref:Bicarbonate transporter-like transmembrane domain-containing protein n=1 Tax=Petrolisthes manimaculis TaxID=1843537 RepID=A0AAE1U8T1_9EUCA|nr:hypothetical protein Pmani_016394 [Petrolisthes manimaculis]
MHRLHFADKTKYWREFEEDGDQMDNLIGVGETLLISCVNGLLFALFACQPLLNVGATEPLMIFHMSLYHFAKTYELDFLSLRVWIGVWMTVFGLLVAAFEAVAIVKKFTRFTEEIFSTLVCLIFIYESFVKLIAIFQTHPLISEYVIMTEENAQTNATPTNTTTTTRARYGLETLPQPNTALLSMILMFGTFIIAFKFKHFRNSKFLGRSLVSFTWQCREEGEELPSEGEKVTSDPPTSREEYGTGQGHEGGGCWGQGPGMMSNASPNFSISVNLFRTPYITYKIEVATRSKDGRTSGTGVEVEVVEGDPPTLTSACSPPWICRQVEGAQLVNPQKLILESGCVVEAGEEAVGEDGCGKVPLNVAGVAGSLIQPLDVMDVAIGLNQRKLALLDDFWVKFGSQFRTFDVQVTATRPGETSEGLALQRIRINEAPVGGTCTAEVMQDIHKDEEEEEEEEGSFEVEVRVGREEPPTLIVTALTDTVILNCTDWEDPEGFEIPKYSFFATTERGEKVTLTLSSKVILPYANLTLWAGVSDQLGAETLYMTAVVIPLLPSQELFKEYQTRKTRLKAVSARDQTRVDMLLRNNKANDEEEEDESSATQEKNKDMLSSVDKFSITSMDEVLQVNNILGSIADPLPKESQEGAVAALKTLAGAADSTAPLAQQKDFASGALATTASLLTGVNKNVKKGNGTSEKRAEKMVAMARRRLRRSIWNQTEDEEEEEVEEEYLPSEEDEDANKKVSLTLESWMVVWWVWVEQHMCSPATAPLDFIIHIPRDEGWSVEPEVVEPRVSNTMPLSIHKVEVPLPNLGVSVLVMPASGSWPGLPRSSMVLLNTLKISSISMNLTITLTQDSMSYFWTLRQ